MTVTPAPLVDTTEPDMAGRKLGDYQLLRRLGRGGMAEVYLAEQLSLRRQVAMKTLRASLAGDTAYIRRFHHEAQSAARLVHANIVQIYEVGCVEGTHYIAQEYVPGQNLKQLMARLGGGLDAPQAASIIRQVAAALHKAAEQNITHRDIKPENIMITPAGEVKVADFGLARVAQAGEALNLTQVGITMGTPLYMSPEQVEGKDVDPRSDIYSLGVTSYHMLAGRPPFDGETALAVAVQHLKTEPKRLEAIRADLPEGLCRVVHKMLAKQPRDRYQKAIELLRDLKGLSIEGLEGDWVGDLPVGAGDSALALAGRLEATQQLSRVLKTELHVDPRRKTLSRAVLLGLGLVIGGFAIGGAVAWLTQPPPLLGISGDKKLGIKQFETVKDQYFYAQMAGHDQEAAWQAVAKYFPPEANPQNLRYSRLAERGLAQYYLTNERLPEALYLYQQLAKVEPSEVEFHLAGIAGEAIVYDKLFQPEETILRLVELRAREADLSRIGKFLQGEVKLLFEKYPPQGE